MARSIRSLSHACDLYFMLQICDVCLDDTQASKTLHVQGFSFASSSVSISWNSKEKKNKKRAVPSTQLLPVPPNTHTHTHTHTHTPTGHVLDSLSPALKAVLSPSSVPLPLKCILSSALIPLNQIAVYHLRSGIPSELPVFFIYPTAEIHSPHCS